jgi:alkylation response protein AidB-like acyl-CoA dehydrogenase
VSDFTLSEGQELLRAAAERFARGRLAPGAKQRERDHAIPHALIEELGEHGLLGVNIPESLGGAEAGVVGYVLALREVAKADASVAVTMAVTNMVSEVITKFGTPAQREKHVPKLVSGEYFAGAFALSEPSHGSDVANLQTRAKRTSKGWSLSGEKAWITSGDGAGVMVVWARTEGDGAKGITCFLVENGAPGLSAGKPEEKMGLIASHTVSLALDGVEVGEDAVLGEIGGGFRIAMTALDGGRIGISAQAIGMAARALEVTRDYVTTRKQFKKTLAEQQAVQFMLADMATELDASWLLALRAAWLKENGYPFSREAAMAKVFSTEAANRIIRDAVQLHGGYGYMEESEVARLYRDCRVTQIYEGTSEIQRMVIARDLLRG